MDFQRAICSLVALLAIASVAGCSASEPQFAATYSAIGAQIK
jgi:hypothetical protein